MRKPGKKSKSKGHILEGMRVSVNVKRLARYQNIQKVKKIKKRLKDGFRRTGVI